MTVLWEWSYVKRRRKQREETVQILLSSCSNLYPNKLLHFILSGSVCQHWDVQTHWKADVSSSWTIIALELQVWLIRELGAGLLFVTLNLGEEDFYFARLNMFLPNISLPKEKLKKMFKTRWSAFHILWTIIFFKYKCSCWPWKP